MTTKRLRPFILNRIPFTKIGNVLAADPDIKLCFVCSPGNPTGTLIPLSDIRALLDNVAFKGVVVVDEAYIDFSGDHASAASLVCQYENLCVMQTLSKSYGLAGIRYVPLPMHLVLVAHIRLKAWNCPSPPVLDPDSHKYESALQYLVVDCSGRKDRVVPGGCECDGTED